MKRLLPAVFLLLILRAPAQTLNWASSFSPAWAHGNVNGNANGIGGGNVSSTVSSSISGGTFGLANLNSGAQTPTVTGAVYVAPANGNLIELATNFSDNAQNASVTINFSSSVTYVSFYIVDIDKKNSNNKQYLDRVTVTGSNDVTTFNPALSKFDAVTDPNFLAISGNSATVNATNGQAGDAASTLADQRGTILVNFGSTVLKSVTIVFDNAPGANNNPGTQSIGVGNILFTQVTLPARLTAFNAKRTTDNVMISWTSVEESNLSSYEIQRSEDGNNWSTIGITPARGNTGSATNYIFTDAFAPSTLLFYRLQQNDLDHQLKYSAIARVNAESSRTEMLAYPNPFSHQFNLSIYSPQEQIARFALYDRSGQAVNCNLKNLSAGQNNFTITQLASLPPGIYIAEIKNLNGVLLGRTSLLK